MNPGKNMSKDSWFSSSLCFVFCFIYVMSSFFFRFLFCFRIEFEWGKDKNVGCRFVLWSLKDRSVNLWKQWTNELDESNRRWKWTNWMEWRLRSNGDHFIISWPFHHSATRVSCENCRDWWSLNIAKWYHVELS